MANPDIPAALDRIRAQDPTAPRPLHVIVSGSVDAETKIEILDARSIVLASFTYSEEARRAARAFVDAANLAVKNPQ